MHYQTSCITKHHGTKSLWQRAGATAGYHSSFFEPCALIIEELVADLLPFHRGFGCFGVRRMPYSFLHSVFFSLASLSSESHCLEVNSSC